MAPRQKKVSLRPVYKQIKKSVRALKARRKHVPAATRKKIGIAIRKLQGFERQLNAFCHPMTY